MFDPISAHIFAAKGGAMSWSAGLGVTPRRDSDPIAAKGGGGPAMHSWCIGGQTQAFALLCALILSACACSSRSTPEDVSAQDAVDSSLGDQRSLGDAVDVDVHLGQWTFGGPFREEARSLFETADGDLVMAGYTESWGQGDWDGLVVRSSACGQVKWAKAYGAKLKDALNGGGALASGGLAVVGVTHSFERYVEAWVMKLDDAGEVQWSKAYGGGGHDLAVAVTETLSGDLIVLGETYNFGPGTPDNHNLSVMRVRGSDGALLWDRVYGGGDAGDAGFALLRTGGPEQRFVIAGATESFGAGRDDVWLIQHRADGVMDWSRVIGDVQDDESRAIYPDSNGGYLISGFTRTWTQGKSDGFVLRVDQDGQPSWLRSYGSAERERFYGAYPVGAGWVALGHSQTFGDGEVDGLVALLDTTGAVVSSWLLGGNRDDEILASTRSADGTIWFAGWNSSKSGSDRDLWFGHVPVAVGEPCGTHALSEGKLKRAEALPPSLSVSPVITSGFEIQDAPVSTESLAFSTSELCSAADCSK